MATLNRYTFHGNVLNSGSPATHVSHWVVFFGTDWDDRCMSLFPAFQTLSRQWEDKMNGDLVHSAAVRFALVDCGTDKELCNEQGVQDYPTVVHYGAQRSVGQWLSGSGEGLVPWLKGELTGRRPRRSRKGATADSSKENLHTRLAFAADTTSTVLPVVPLPDPCEPFSAANVAMHLALTLIVIHATLPPQWWQLFPQSGPTRQAVAARRRSGVARYLPEQWARDRPSLSI